MVALRLAWGLGAAGLVALAGCVPDELVLARGDEGGADAPRDVRARDRAETPDAPPGHDAMRDVERDATFDAGTDATSDAGPVDGKPPKDSAPTDAGPSIFCGASAPPCPVPEDECCVAPAMGSPTYTCQSASMASSCAKAGDTPVSCGEAADCPGAVCCGTKTGPYSNQYAIVACESSCTSAINLKITFCNPSASPDVCGPLGLTCKTSVLLPGFNVCM